MTRWTWTAVHLAPLAVGMPRPFNPAAIALRETAPVAFRSPAHGGLRVARYALFKIFEIAAKLFERKAESKQTFYGVARQIARDTLAAKRGDLGGVAIEARIDGVQRLCGVL